MSANPQRPDDDPDTDLPMTMSERMFAEAYAKGITPAQARAGSTFARGIAKAGIVRSADFKRIEALPRREWGVSQKELEAALKAPKTPGAQAIIAKAEELEAIRKEMTKALRVRGGSMELWPVQAAALSELCEWKGLFGQVLAGGGKTIITIMAPWLVGAKRPLLLVPASLRDQTLRVVIPSLSRHWKIPHGLRILAYSELSLAKNATILDRIQPDLIIADEAQMIAAHKSGRTRRVRRYMNDHPDTMVVALSGTITRRSIKDYHQLALWALKPDLVPLPVNWPEVEDWADALDEGVDESRIVAPGALRRLCGTIIDEDTKKERPETAREGYRRRLVQTPGVIATAENDLGVSLEIDFVDFKLPESVREIMKHMRDTWEDPNGDYLTNAIDLWRHARELSCGMWLKWDPPAPKEWMRARKAWKKYVRETLKNNRHGLDTELQVWTECATAEKTGAVIKRSAAFDEALRTNTIWGQSPDDESRTVPMFTKDDYDEAKHGPWYLREFTAWKKVKDTFKINTVPVWEDLGLVRDVIERLKKKPTIAWVEHPAVGEKIAELSGLHYYGAGDGGMIDASGKESCIASIRAQGVGKNLPAWSENLVVMCPPSGALLEQLLARTHRFGQKADTVYFHVYMHTEELQAGWRQALSDAKYIFETTGQRQRLSYARIIDNWSKIARDESFVRGRHGGVAV